ncbi:hypothetical protein GCM10010172_36200 [Paractinoplanes ferrugineus]|uniref:Hint domain-containing protein n=1 Tax=Paractinoplanes ferrugineus TaxID=113564 RepID=A0A919J267_9ACTN|nr:polymorphic toxin-type HINT domain-containing protein [Actinoplanes ferrugineus]GIE09216.1 hypothetical protein Afe05nite_10560 [Actinoplanes ferrugineus]
MLTKVFAIVLAALLASFVAPAEAKAAPTKAPAATAGVTEIAPFTGIDEDELDRMLVQDLADYDEDAEVRAAAQAVLAGNDPVKIRDFLDNGLPIYRKAADTRKKVVAAENKALVQEWAGSGGPIVRERAAAALASKNDNKIADFVTIGHAAAEAADAQQVITAAEQAKTIKARVEQIATQGGYEVHAGAVQALESEDPAVIAEFYNTGYKEAGARDTAAQQAIEQALAVRAKAVSDLADLAQKATTAADAQKQIITSSVSATSELTVTANSMGLVNRYAKQADAVYAADLPIRRSGGQTHTADLTRLRSDACAESATTARRAAQVTAHAGVADTAARTLVSTGLSNGVDWAEVMQAQSGAATAAMQAAETACHAAEATEAAAKTLDADRNATVEANNAVKYRQAAEKEQAAAERLAVQAEKLAVAAQAAEADAHKQRLRAEQKADEAKDHAQDAEDHYYNARNYRDEARSAAAVAVEQQLRARDAALRAIAQQDVAKAKYEASQPLYADAVAANDRFAKKAAVAQDILKRAQVSYRNAKSKELEAQAAEARKLAVEVNCKHPDAPAPAGCPGPEEEAQIRRDAERLGSEATAARSAADSAQGYADDAAAAVEAAGEASRRAAAAAAAAGAEARAAADEARAAHQAAVAAADAANIAIADAKKANELALAAVNTARKAMNHAVAAKADAELTSRSADESVRQSGIATFQAAVAGRAALNARVSAIAIAEPAATAIDVSSVYADTDNDAAMAFFIATDALSIGAEQSAAAERHAADAAAAAVHAEEQATKAEAQVKPAFVAAQKAAAAAERAVKASKAAIAAADGARKEAQAAAAAAQEAAQWDQKAAYYAAAADQMASQANYDAGTARQAYNSAKAYSTQAQNAATNAGKYADTTELMGTSAINMANAIHNVAKEIGRLPKNLQEAMWEAYNAEQQARETEWQRWLKTQSDKALSKLPWGGDIAKGAMETFLDNVNSMWLIGNCAIGPNAAAGDAYSVPDVSIFPNSDKTCDALITGVKQMFAHPENIIPDLVHWDEWGKNWQKALGMTLVDVGSLAIPGIGAAGKAMKAGKFSNLGKLLRDDVTAATLLFGRETIETAVKKLGTINVAKLLDLKVDTKLKFDFTPDEIDKFLKAVDIHGLDEVENALRGIGEMPALPKLKELVSGCGGGNSFTAETPVLLADGTTRPIAEIQIGDLVRATDPLTGESSDQPVTSVYRNQDTDLADVVLTDGATIHTTAHHLFWEETSRLWTDAADLRPGHLLRTGSGSLAEVADVRTFPGDQAMYDLTVEAVHTYYVFAGAEAILVHNKAGGLFCDITELKGDEPGTALRLMAQRDWNGGQLRGFVETNGPDFIDEKGRVYDAVGGPNGWTNAKYNEADMLKSIMKHIYLKSGFDFTVLDLTGATSKQIDAVFEALDKWAADPKMKPLNKLIILGEDYD